MKLTEISTTVAWDVCPATSDELFAVASALARHICFLKDRLSDIYDEIDARLDIADYMSLAGVAAREGKLITDEWLWEDWEDDPNN